MFASKAVLSQSKLTQTSDITDFLQQTGYLFKESSGLYSLSTLGALALNRLEQSLHHALRHAGATQWMLSLLQSDALWERTNRAQDYGDELMSVTLRSGQLMRLSATAEEQITNMVQHGAQGRHVDHWFYQMGTKWRDEIRARGGLLRSREFRMMDAYHFVDNEEKMLAAHHASVHMLSNWFVSKGCAVRAVESDCGEIGGSLSHELQVQTSLADDGWLEVGHCFALGQKYSQAFDFKNATGDHVWMACQGVGTTRLLAVLLHNMRQGNRLCGNDKFSVCDDVIVSIGVQDQTQERARQLYELLRGHREVVWEDRYQRAGQALSASETLGARRRIVVSDRLGDKLEVTNWSTNTTHVVDDIQQLLD